MGGTHVDPKVPDKDIALYNSGFYIGDLLPPDRAIYDIAVQTFKLIDYIISNIQEGKETVFVRKKQAVIKL